MARTRRNIILDTALNMVAIQITEGKKTDEDYAVVRDETFSLDDLNPAIQKHCALHGLAQKLADSTADMKASEGYTDDDRFARMNDVYTMLASGNWKKPSTGGAGKISQAKVERDMNALGLTPEQYEMAKQLGLIKG